MESHVENRVENVLSTAREGKGLPAKNQLGYCVGSDRDSEAERKGEGAGVINYIVYCTLQNFD